MSSIIMMLSSTLVTTGLSAYTTTSSTCFILQGTYTNGTSLGFLAVEDYQFGVWASFVGESSRGTKLGIDGITGNLINYDGESVQQGFTASTYWDGINNVAGSIVFDMLYFDNPQSLLDPESNEHIAAVCEVDSNNILACAHRWSPDYQIFSYCPQNDIGLVIGDGSDPRFDCEPIVLRANAAQGCVLPTSTPVSSPTPTRTLTTLPTGTVSPSSQPLCMGGKTQCADGFLVRCDKNVYNDSTKWTLAGGVLDEPIGDLPVTSSLECHQACVNRATCAAWKYFEHSFDWLYCWHTNETIAGNVHFHVSDFASYRFGVRGACT
ncbi:hypothetical protein PFICI_04857 [Pestalotiopsis fici W106-1]|uniref:Apple domain-containing protein n=1 Tax=Pestalotiopsis fici (strain W106-1 / CGMCC3.15140) TaxID=1229662 RepID=W3XCS4_PESFW|nr:uncharacterized protein PFICI_04857 [Pestalotiopsis fici W106-1]ETS82981.1 hypothetical protein PFICI_04857 [Pestalotiopsis fici W106-1]